MIHGTTLFRLKIGCELFAEKAGKILDRHTDMKRLRHTNIYDENDEREVFQMLEWLVDDIIRLKEGR